MPKCQPLLSRPSSTEWNTHRPNNICNMGNTRPTRSTKVQNLTSWMNIRVFNTPKYTSSELGPERIPYSIFDFCGLFIRPRTRTLNRNSDTFFTIYRFTWDEISCDEHLLFTLGDEYARMSVRLDNDVRTALCSAPATSTTATTSTASSTSSSTTGCTTATTSRPT